MRTSVLLLAASGHVVVAGLGEGELGGSNAVGELGLVDGHELDEGEEGREDGAKVAYVLGDGSGAGLELAEEPLEGDAGAVVGAVVDPGLTIVAAGVAGADGGEGVLVG